MVDTGLFWFFYVWTSSFPSTVCWTCCLFPSICYCQISHGCNFLHSCLGLLLCFIGLYIFTFWFCAYTRLFFCLISSFFFFFPMLCNILWYLEWQSLQHFAQDCFGYMESFLDPYAFSNFFFYFCGKYCGYIDWDCIHTNFVLITLLINYSINFPTQQAWAIFPFPTIFIYLCLQRSKVFVEEGLYFLD